MDNIGTNSNSATNITTEAANQGTPIAAGHEATIIAHSSGTVMSLLYGTIVAGISIASYYGYQYYQANLKQNAAIIEQVNQDANKIMAISTATDTNNEQSNHDATNSLVKNPQPDLNITSSSTVSTDTPTSTDVKAPVLTDSLGTKTQNSVGVNTTVRKALPVASTETKTETIKPKTSACIKAEGGFAGQIEDEINKTRQEYGAPKVTACVQLRASSKLKYLDFFEQGKITHSWAGGKRIQDVIRAQGYPAKNWGEIIEWGSEFTTAKEHVDNWMSSPPHKAILINPIFTHFGVYVDKYEIDEVEVDIAVAQFGLE